MIKQTLVLLGLAFSMLAAVPASAVSISINNMPTEVSFPAEYEGGFSQFPPVPYDAYIEIDSRDIDPPSAIWINEWDIKLEDNSSGVWEHRAYYNSLPIGEFSSGLTRVDMFDVSDLLWQQLMSRYTEGQGERPSSFQARIELYIFGGSYVFDPTTCFDESFLQGGCPDAVPIGGLTSSPVTFTVNYVPIPAAAWLFGSALIGLAGIKRKK